MSCSRQARIAAGAEAEVLEARAQFSVDTDRPKEETKALLWAEYDRMVTERLVPRPLMNG